MLQFINSADILSTKSLPLKKGKYVGILIRWTGTNKTGQAVSIGDLGFLSLTKDSRPIVNINAEQLYAINEYLFGKPRTTSVTSSNFDFGLYIPFNLMSVNAADTNAIILSDSDYISIPGLPTSKIDNATVSIYGDYDDLPTLYVPNLFSRTVTLSQEVPIYIPDNNLYLIAWKRPSTPPSKVIITRDNGLIFDAPHEVLEIATSLSGYIETSPFNYVILLLSTNLSNLHGTSYNMQMVGGSGELSYSIYSAQSLFSVGPIGEINLAPITTQAE